MHQAGSLRGMAGVCEAHTVLVDGPFTYLRLLGGSQGSSLGMPSGYEADESLDTWETNHPLIRVGKRGR
jgi:hypothetical protein